MILTTRIAHGVAAGDITLAFRRWARPRIKAGSTMRTVAGVVRVDSIEQIDPGRLDTDDAKHAGYASLEELVATFRGPTTNPLWRLSLSWVGPDPRDALADDTALSPADIATIDALLDRLDARSPWAHTTLERIGSEPGVTAARLAAELPIDKDGLKRRIRTLKEHGLTRSLTSGYELSARGRAYLAGSDGGHTNGR